MRANPLRSPKELSGGAAKNTPLKAVEHKLGRGLSHLLPGSLASNNDYWSRVFISIEASELGKDPQIAQIPSFMLPILKRMNEKPFNMLVSIPRSGDPLAYTLLEMCEGVERLGFPAIDLPEHESFGGGRSPSIINCTFFSATELKREISPEEKLGYLQLVEDLDKDSRYALFRDGLRDQAEQCVHFWERLDSDLGAIVRWFMMNYSPSFIKAAQPVLAEIIKEASLAQEFRKIKDILIVDDCTNDLDAYHSVEYPLSVLAPHTNREVGLMAGTVYDEMDINAICGILWPVWTIMDNWVGPKAPPSPEMGERTIELMKIKDNLDVSHLKKPALKEVFSYLTRKVLYENGLIFEQGTSWKRREMEQKYAKKYGEKVFRNWQEYMFRNFTPDYVAGLVSSSRVFARIYQAIGELRAGMDRLFGNEINQVLLKAYLENPRDFKELRPVSDLLILMNQQGENS